MHLIRMKNMKYGMLDYICDESVKSEEWGYMAEFVYNGVYYYLSGIMEQNYFDEILKKIHF